MASRSSTILSSPQEAKLMFSPDRFIVYRRNNGYEHIHIREYICKMIGAEQRILPTTKGVCFTPGRLRTFLDTINEIDFHVNNPTSVKFKGFLGSGMYVTADEHGVDLRREWVRTGQKIEVPSELGIYLPISQWITLKQKLVELLTQYPHLEFSNPRICDDLMEIMSCQDCFAFGWHME